MSVDQLAPLLSLRSTRDWLYKIGASPWILVLVAVNFLVGLGTVPLFDLDEGAFSAATMEMLQRQDFITTYLGGELRFDKPILIY